jgi:hypothetical protein
LAATVNETNSIQEQARELQDTFDAMIADKQSAEAATKQLTDLVQILSLFDHRRSNDLFVLALSVLAYFAFLFHINNYIQ